MLKGALDFWMEPPNTYFPILAKKAESENDIKKEKDEEVIQDVINIHGSGICWFTLPEQPLSYHLFLNIRGSENFHLYLWLIKDLSWAQSWYYAGHIFGSLAVIWSFFILFHAARERNTNEVFVGVAQTMWLMANVWWMTGDLHDNKFQDQPTWYDARTEEAGHMMQAALCWLGVYYLIVKPFKLFGCDDPEALRHYDNTGQKPRFSWLFSTWREYENCHILFWLGKDCAWNGLIPSMWIIFVIPTMLIAVDFVYVSLYSKRLIIDHAHYVAQLIWVTANAVWAGGELFDQRYDTPFPLINPPAEAFETLRWYSSWVLIIACIPIVILYIVWLFFTLNGKIAGDAIKNESHKSESHKNCHDADSIIHNDQYTVHLNDLESNDDRVRSASISRHPSLPTLFHIPSHDLELALNQKEQTHSNLDEDSDHGKHGKESLLGLSIHSSSSSTYKNNDSNDSMNSNISKNDDDKHNKEKKKNGLSHTEINSNGLSYANNPMQRSQSPVSQTRKSQSPVLQIHKSSSPVSRSHKPGSPLEVPLLTPDSPLSNNPPGNNPSANMKNNIDSDKNTKNGIEANNIDINIDTNGDNHEDKLERERTQGMDLHTSAQDIENVKLEIVDL